MGALGPPRQHQARKVAAADRAWAVRATRGVALRASAPRAVTPCAFAMAASAARTVWPQLRLAKAVTLCVVAMAVGAMAGCTGSADIRFVSLHPKEIDPPETEVRQYQAQECYWWTDDAGDLHLAMKCARHDLLLGKLGRVDLDVSLTLGKPPAGRARNYDATAGKARALFFTPLQSVRLNSVTGIISVVMDDDGTMHGSFRIWMNTRAELQVLAFLPHNPGPMLCFGTYRAVEDAQRGAAIRAACESVNNRQPPLPTSAPATSESTPQPVDSRP